MRKNLKSKIRAILLCGFLTMSTISISTKTVNAQDNLEAEFSSMLENYNPEDVIVDNGVSLSIGETLDLKEAKGWKLSNDEIVNMDENGVIQPLKEGTVFLSKNIEGKVHILEIYVTSGIKPYSIRSNNVDRDYYKVFVDAGHGGSDNGASGNGYLEDELNLQVAKKVESKLRQKGIDVKMSRTSDVYLSLGQRSELANQYGADVFVSIHQNSATSSSASGIETYHHTNKTNHKSYAQEIQKRAISETGARDRGVKSANFAVLRETNMASALFESGFISNKNESKNLANQSYQDKLATAISNGIEAYLKNNITLTNNENVSGVSYQTHVQDYGWQSWKANGQSSGTSGQSKRLEAIKIKVNDIIPGANIVYRTHVQDNGWQEWKSNGQMSGTNGQSKRLEAIEIKLENAPGYKAEYRVHIQDHGWQEWKSNGEVAGTVGQSKRLEAIEINIVKEKIPNIEYRTHVQDYGWQPWKSNGEQSGTTGEAKRLEGIEIKLSNAPSNSRITYQTHVQDYGWQAVKSNGELSGTIGEAKRLEAIKMKLENAPGYKIEYRVHVQDYGWQDWKTQDQIAGTIGEAKRLEAIEARVVKE